MIPIKTLAAWFPFISNASSVPYWTMRSSPCFVVLFDGKREMSQRSLCRISSSQPHPLTYIASSLSGRGYPQDPTLKGCETKLQTVGWRFRCLGFFVGSVFLILFLLWFSIRNMKEGRRVMSACMELQLMPKLRILKIWYVIVQQPTNWVCQYLSHTK